MCIAICGNSIDLINNVSNKSMDLIFLDPPFGDNTVNEDWDKFNPITEEFVYRLHEIGKPHASIYICCGLGRQSQSFIDMYNLFKDCGFYFQDQITWVKSRGIGMRKGWLYTREELLWFTLHPKDYIWNVQYSDTEKRIRDKHGQTLGNNGKPRKSEYKRITNIWSDIPDQASDVTGKNKIHKTPKPEKLLQRIINAHTYEGMTVFDPFAGTGTTGAMCKLLNRNYYMIEKDKSYCDFSEEYYKEYGINYVRNSQSSIT
jgi:DNA modification methylase